MKAKRKAARKDMPAGAADARLALNELIARAGELAARGDAPGAAALYRGWIEANPADPGLYAARFNLGCALYGQGAMREAAEQFVLARAASPGFHQAALYLGFCRLNLGQTSEARELFDAIAAAGRAGEPVDAETLRLARHSAGALAAEPARAEPAAPAGPRRRTAHLFTVCYSQETYDAADPGFGRLDAVLCLMQAAWAQAQHEAGATRWGLSPDLDPVEGWILTA